MMRRLLPFLPLMGGCWAYSERDAEMYVFHNGEERRVFGFLPADWVKERAYFFTIMMPLKLYLATPEETVRMFADLHVLTLDKQRNIKRAFLVSEPITSSPNGARVLLKRGDFNVGSIHLRLKETGVSVVLDSLRAEAHRNSHHTYVWIRTLPPARNFPEVIYYFGGDSLEMFPVEKAPFLVKHHGRLQYKYQEWYDRWIFTVKTPSPLPPPDSLKVKAHIFMVGDTSLLLKRI